METNNNQNFQSLENFIMHCEEVVVSKRGFFAALFAPKYKVICKTTGEEMKLKSETYTMSDGNEIEHIFNSGKAPEGKHFSPSANGNVMVEFYHSADNRVMIAQVQRFLGFGYQPVTDVVVFKDKQAEDIIRLFI